MKRTRKFTIGLLAAALTFSALTVTLGTDHWKRYNRWGHKYYHHHDCEKADTESDSTSF